MTPLTIDDSDRGSYHVRGYATTWDDPYPFGPEGWTEVIDRHALDGADMSDVIFQYDHCGMVMARMSNGTLRISIDDHGLLNDSWLNGCAAARDLYEAISNGLVTKMSWGFSVPDDGWQVDYEARRSVITRITKVYDLSAVSLPANPGSEIKARSYLDGAIEARRLEECRRRAAVARIRLTGGVHVR